MVLSLRDGSRGANKRTNIRAAVGRLAAAVFLHDHHKAEISSNRKLNIMLSINNLHKIEQA
jgi:hypothetical protein